MLHPTILDPAGGRTADPPAVRPPVPVSTDPFELLRVLGTQRPPPGSDDNELGRRRRRRFLDRATSWYGRDTPA
jgi:hypothetical protein